MTEQVLRGWGAVEGAVMVWWQGLGPRTKLVKVSVLVVPLFGDQAGQPEASYLTWILGFLL